MRKKTSALVSWKCASIVDDKVRMVECSKFLTVLGPNEHVVHEERVVGTRADDTD